MARYFIKRLLLIPVLVIAVSMLIFFLVHLSKVDPAYTILGPTAKPEQVAAFHAKYGLDDPLVVQYVTYMKNLILHGDLGTSYFSGTPVAKEIARVLPVTIKLAFSGFILSVIIGTVLGIVCAVKQYSAVDNIISLSAMFLSTFPSFLLGILLMLVFTVKLKWLPARGLTSFKSYILPVLSLMLPSFSLFIRYTRSAMLDTIRQDYIRTARSKGESERRVIFRDALRNALLPIAAFVGSILAEILSTTTIAEQLFTIPGLGNMIIKSINRKDIPMVMGCVLFLSVVYIVVTVLVDLSFTLIDPRVKASLVGKKKVKRKDLYQMMEEFRREDGEFENTDNAQGVVPGLQTGGGTHG